MKIHLSADYQSEIWFYPVCRTTGETFAVELVTQFLHPDAKVTLPQALILPQLDKTQQLRFLQNQISTLESQREFFVNHQLSAILPLSETLAEILINSETLVHKIKKLPFILLALSSDFPSLATGINHPLIKALRKRFRLALFHFGAGSMPVYALDNDLFEIIRLDRELVHTLAKRHSFQAFMQSIVNHTRHYCQHIIIDGVDSDLIGENVVSLPGLLMQGTLFPPVSVEAADDLIALQSSVSD